MAGKKRQYSDTDKATALAALDANGGNVAQTARALKIPRMTLEEWARGRNQNPSVTEIRHEKRIELADMFEGVARLYLQHATQDVTVADTRGKDAVIAAATAVDKMQLLRGKPTTILAESARSTIQEIIQQTGITEERARAIVAAQFGMKEQELVSESVN